MMQCGLDLLSLADFRLVAAHGGFGRAARKTGRSKATLSRRIRDLEASLGRRLIERNGPTISLTEDGRILLATTQAPLDELDAAGDAFRRRESRPYGTLRVSVPLVFGQLAMGFIAARFREAYPQVALEISCEDRFVDLLQEGFHVAIRVNPRSDDDAVGRLLLRQDLLVVAPATLHKPALDGSAKPVSVPAVVRVSGWDGTAWRWHDEQGFRTSVPDRVLSLSSALMIRDAVVAGAGAALLPRFLVGEHLESGRLREWGTSEDHRIEVWIVHASHRLVSDKVRVFIDFLIEAFAERSFEVGLDRLKA